MIFKTLLKVILKALLKLLEVILKALDNPNSKRYEYDEYTYDPYALDYCTAHFIYDIPDDIDDI